MKTTCRNGHDKTAPGATYVDYEGYTRCRECRRIENGTAGRSPRPAPGRQATHCRRGHEYRPETTYHYVNPKTGKPFQVCATCKRDGNRRYQAQCRG